MNLYFKLQKGKPVGHPIVEQNILDAYEVASIDAAFLAENNFAVFERPTIANSTVVLSETGYKLDDDGIVRPTFETREKTQEEKINEWVRAPRDIYLARSDWTQSSDSPLSAEKKAEWAAYRQELRDMPDVYADIQDPSEIVPPTPPAK